MARVAALDRDSGDAGRVDCVIDPPTGARMFKLLPVTVADRKAVYRLVTDDEAEFDREVLVLRVSDVLLSTVNCDGASSFRCNTHIYSGGARDLVMPPLQPGTPILSALNKLKINTNLR